MRVDLGGKGQALDGDLTTTGATCIATGASYTSNGRMVLRMGDSTTACPLCGEIGKVVEGVSLFISDGRAVAMDGALVACGCPSGSNRVVAPLNRVEPIARATPVADSSYSQAATATPRSLSNAAPRHAVDSLPFTQEPGFYLVPRSMSFPQGLMHLAEQDSTLPLSRLQMLNPTYQQGFKGGEIFVIGDPDNGHACTREEGQLMAAPQQARESLALLDRGEADFMMLHQAEIAGLLNGASQSMGVGKDMLEQGLGQVRATLVDIERLHQQQFARYGHLKSPEFFAARQGLLNQLDGQLKTAFLNKQLNLGSYERLRRDLGISTKSLIHHWSRAGGPGQIPGYATHLDEVAKTAKYLKYGGAVGTGLGGAASYLKVQEVCRAGESAECRKIRMTEAGSFAIGMGGATLGAKLGGVAAGAVCGVFSIGTGGLGTPICALVLVGGGSAVGGLGGSAVGERLAEELYEFGHD